VHQIPIRRELFARGFSFSDGPFDSALGDPFDLSLHTGTYVAGNRWTFFRIELEGLPASSSWRFRYFRPDASVAGDFSGNFGNPFYIDSWWWWSLNVNLSQTGTWRLVLDVNGQTMADAPFTVVSDPSQIVNRPPNGVSVAFDPVSPSASDVTFCRVQTSLVLRDPDYDIVRYHYQWSINGTAVRDIVSAALSDAIPSANAGDLVMCTVTPSDGLADGPQASTSVVISGGASPTRTSGVR
jgi:hypothetical protein